MLIYHRKKAVKEKNGRIKENVLAAHFWVLTAFHLTFFTTSLPLLCIFFFQGEVVLWQKYTTAATLSRDWTTGIMCREVFVQLQWVISVRLRYRLLLHVLWCVAIPEFTDLISFPIWCLLSSSPCDELLITRLWQEFPCIWPTALLSGSRRTGVLRLWSPRLLFPNSKP